jgi:hypothetical protein
MLLPAAMPFGASLWATAVLLEIGVAGLFASLVARTPWIGASAVVIVCGFGVFALQALWMLRHRRPRPPAIRTPDPAMLHAALAFLSLAAACGMGLALATFTPSAGTLRLAAAYGVLGLVGFLAQMVVAMEGRLLPIFAWYWRMANAGGAPVPSPHEMPWRAGQLIVFGLWAIGVPLLAAGLAFDALDAIRGGALALLTAALLDSLQAALILRHAYVRPGER